MCGGGGVGLGWVGLVSVLVLGVENVGRLCSGEAVVERGRAAARDGWYVMDGPPVYRGGRSGGLHYRGAVCNGKECPGSQAPLCVPGCGNGGASLRGGWYVKHVRHM